MKTLLWKELRENFRWALLATIAFAAACAFGLYNSDPNDYYSSSAITVLKPSFLMATTFGAPAVGLFLAFLHTLPDLKTDRWAALLHRPIPFTTVFWAKALSGVIFYLLAVGIPYAVFVILVATPGNFDSPFLPAMLSPSIADLAAGLLYFFAALIVALQRVRPFIVRPIPLLAALHVSFFLIETKLFYVAIEAIIAMAAVLLLTAWGVMRSRDNIAGRPFLARLACLVVVFYGICGLGDLVLMLARTFYPKSISSEVFRYAQTKDVGPPVRLYYKTASSPPSPSPTAPPPPIRSSSPSASTLTSITATTSPPTSAIPTSPGNRPLHGSPPTARLAPIFIPRASSNFPSRPAGSTSSTNASTSATSPRRNSPSTASTTPVSLRSPPLFVPSPKA